MKDKLVEKYKDYSDEKLLSAMLSGACFGVCEEKQSEFHILCLEVRRRYLDMMEDLDKDWTPGMMKLDTYYK